MDNTKKEKKPWPTKKAMDQVYDMNLWGEGDGMFYSGEGSHLSEIVEPYINSVVSFLKSFNKPITVCDLGCGDFNIGKQLVKHTQKYIAIDIVLKLIEYNKSVFTEEKVEFHCLDIATDTLPNADCVIIRQVLQHLSNAEIINVVSKLQKFKYVILTEHLPTGNFTANKDIISGQGIRLKKKSGVNLLSQPFNFQVKKQKQLTSFRLKENKGEIVTTLYQVF